MGNVFLNCFRNKFLKGGNDMTVYIEDCLIENFVVTFLILKNMNLFFKFKPSKCRTIFGCVLGALFAMLYPAFNFSGVLLTLLKLAVGVLIVCVVYSKNILSKYIIFMLFTAIYAGLNIAIYYLIYGTSQIYDNFATYILLLVLLVIYFVLSLCLKVIKKQATVDGFVYRVKILDAGKLVLTNAFLDSGNTLLDEDSTPILIINFNLFNKLYCDIDFADLLSKNFKSLKNPHYVKSGFASGGANILVFCVDEIQIELKSEAKTIKNARLGVSYSKFAKNFNCDMLLNLNVFNN